MYAHACHGWHTWGGMVSVVDLAQDNRTNLVAAQLSKELTRQVSTGTLVLNGRKNGVQLSQGRRQFRAGCSGRGGSSSSLSVVGVRGSR